MIAAYAKDHSLTDKSRALVALLMLTIWLAAPFTPMRMLPTDVVGVESRALAALLASQTICHAYDTHDPGPASHDPTHPTDHGRDCGMCPVCHGLGTPVLVPAPGVLPAAPVRLAGSSPTLRPPATGPPPAPRAAAHPRGPPASFV